MQQSGSFHFKRHSHLAKQIKSSLFAKLPTVLPYKKQMELNTSVKRLDASSFHTNAPPRCFCLLIFLKNVACQIRHWKQEIVMKLIHKYIWWVRWVVSTGIYLQSWICTVGFKRIWTERTWSILHFDLLIYITKQLNCNHSVFTEERNSTLLVHISHLLLTKKKHTTKPHLWSPLI